MKKILSGEYDFDHPSMFWNISFFVHQVLLQILLAAFDFDLLTEALESLGKGVSVDIPRYDFVENNR